ncbi:MAG TPA: oligopeptide/dipeptide ABC transporter ATP-binding protein [Streptosporangiaceae bacterium]
MTAPAPAPHISPQDAPLLAVESLDVILGRGWRATQVLSGVDLAIGPGEIVGLVGETGSGKTTLARTVAGLVSPAGGRVVFEGTTISALRRGARRAERRRGHLQLVFQDPLRSLDPDMTVAGIVGEGVRLQGETDGSEIRRRVVAALGQVGLDDSLLPRTPAQISGGQRQRVAIARALATEPRLLICDEPVSALDASNRNYILRLLDQLRTSLGLSIVIISHDLSSLAGIADRIVVLYRGRIVEDGPVDQVFAAPRHPYTALLMASAPSVRHDRELSPQQLTRTVAEAVALPEDLLAGLGGPDACVFAPRCAFAAAPCATQPPLVPAGERRSVACHRHDEWMTLARERAAARTSDRNGDRSRGRTTEGQLA